MKSIRSFILFSLISLSASAQTAFDDSAKVFLKEVNVVRSNPKSIKAFLISYTKHKPEYNPGVKIKGHITHDSTGYLSLRDAIAFLDTAKPVDSLVYSEDVYKAIGDHTGIDTIKGVVKHDGKCFKRINHYNKYFRKTGENFICLTKIAQVGDKKKYNQMSMKQALVEFIIDITMYHQKNFRGSHREVIFDKNYKFTAIKFIKVKDKVYLFQEFAGY